MKQRIVDAQSSSRLGHARRGCPLYAPAHEERIRLSDIRVEHRDVLIRLQAMIEDDLGASGPERYSLDAPTSG
jgi:hypothetical protein